MKENNRLCKLVNEKKKNKYRFLWFAIIMQTRQTIYTLTV